MVSALKELGFDYIFDTDFAADLTIMEEASEFLDRLTRFLEGDESAKLPIMTSCCPAWVKFFEHQFPDLLDVPSTTKSPQQMFGAVAKSYFAEQLGIDREKMVVVSVMPCLAKKYEAARPEFAVQGNRDVDIVLSTRELGRLIKTSNIDFEALPDADFDRPLGESTGAGVIFGATGGVLEAALRTAYELSTGETLPKLDFTALRGMEGVRLANICTELVVHTDMSATATVEVPDVPAAVESAVVEDGAPSVAEDAPAEVPEDIATESDVSE
jgi:NADP-reducing hydrogenase subunit HndD